MRRWLARLLLRLSRRLDPAPYGYHKGGLVCGATTMTAPGPVAYRWFLGDRPVAS